MYTLCIKCCPLVDNILQRIPEMGYFKEDDGIRRGRVVSVGYLEPAMWKALGQGTFTSLVLVCVPMNHE